jgi:hypothetical protein
MVAGAIVSDPYFLIKGLQPDKYYTVKNETGSGVGLERKKVNMVLSILDSTPVTLVLVVMIIFAGALATRSLPFAFPSSHCLHSSPPPSHTTPSLFCLAVLVSVYETIPATAAEPLESWVHALMVFITFAFVAEVSLRMYALKLGCQEGEYFDFFTDQGTGLYNVVDLLVTLIDVVSLILELALAASDKAGALGVSTILRVLRFVRLARVMRLGKYTQRFVYVTFYRFKGSELLLSKIPRTPSQRLDDEKCHARQEATDHYAFHHGLRTFLKSFLPRQFVLHVVRVFADWDFEQSSMHEEDFLHVAAHIPPWNFRGVRQILAKRRSALTVYIFCNVMAILNLIGSRSLTNEHECNIGTSSDFDWTAECTLYQQWVLQSVAMWFLVLALIFACSALVSWHNLAVSQKCVRYMSMFSFGVLYVISLWPLSSQSNTNSGAAAGLVSGLFNSFVTLVNISISAICVSQAMTRACRQMRELFPNAEMIRVIELFGPLVTIPVSWAWFSFFAQLFAPLILSSFYDKVVWFITVLFVCAAPVGRIMGDISHMNTDAQLTLAHSPLNLRNASGRLARLAYTFFVTQIELIGVSIFAVFLLTKLDR